MRFICPKCKEKLNIEYSNSLQNEVALDTITESESVKENNITPEKFIDRKDVAQSSNIQIDFTMLEKEALLNTIKDYLNPPKENKAQKNDEMDLLLKRLRNDTTEHLEKMKKTDDYDERVLETMGIIIDCLVDYVGNTEEIREIIGKRLDEAFE
jgi:hypothetical protein